MNEIYLKNARRNGDQIYEYTNQILTALCETIFLISGKECSYDILFDGSVTIVREEEKNIRHKSVTDAIISLANIIDTLYK